MMINFISKSLEFIELLICKKKNFYIIVKMPLQPDKMASRVGLGPRAVVWRLLLYSIGVTNGSYILLCFIYTYR